VKPLHHLSLLLLVLFLLLAAAQACGPDFAPDVFIHQLHPDNPKQYAQGKLGILLPTYPRADLIVAFRYLIGGTLNPAEQAGYQPTYSIDEPTPRDATPQYCDENCPSPADPWMQARHRYLGTTQPISTDHSMEVKTPDGYTYTTNYANCYSDAFRTAVLTLNARAKAWGDNSPDLHDWLQGQDAVFANCDKPSPLPAAAPASASTLLKQDRAYQIAAALFYAQKPDEAAEAFEAISQDSASPWHTIAPYLVTRCLIRKAFLTRTGTKDMEHFAYDPALLQQAADRIHLLLKQNPANPYQKALQDELDLVRIRLEPETRVRELSAALTGPAHDPGFAQHQIDLTQYLDWRTIDVPTRPNSDIRNPDPHVYDPPTPQQRAAAFDTAFLKIAPLRANSQLVDWLLTYQSPSPEAAAHALQQWRSTHTLPWLTAAIAKATDKTTGASALLEAAATIQPGNPAWQTINYHRIRILIALNRAPEARALLAETMPRLGSESPASDSTINAYNGLRMAAASNLTDLLNYAPRRILLHSSESYFALNECLEVMKDPKRIYDCKEDKSPVQFSSDAAIFFNTQAPLSTLVASTQSPVLPETLRRSVAMMAWVRSVLLHDDASAAKLLPLLPVKLQQQAGAGTGFRPLVAIARNPGLRPLLNPGVQRFDAYDFVQSYRDNWWCHVLWSNGYDENPEPVRPVTSAYLSPAERREAAAQLGQLNQMQNAKIYLGSQIIAYVESHLDNQDAAESLYLVLRLIRYGCDDYAYPETSGSKARNLQIDQLRQHASRLLRQHYAVSPWTRKAAPFAG
jgi:hypothetical protein